MIVYKADNSTMDTFNHGAVNIIPNLVDSETAGVYLTRWQSKPHIKCHVKSPDGVHE